MLRKVLIWFRNLYLGFIGVGAILFVADWTYRKLTGKEEEKYVRISIYYPSYESELVKGEERIQSIFKEFERFRGLKRTVWGFPPDCKTYVSLWHGDEEYELCRGQDGRWYVGLPGSWKGRSTTNYYKLSKEEADLLIERIRKEVRKGAVIYEAFALFWYHGDSYLLGLSHL